jgi:competence protein ComFB
MIMEIHNTTEDIVFEKVEAIFESIKNEGNPDAFCLCDQCRLDTVCYALNRAAPHYIVSNRGAARAGMENLEHQQQEADIAVVIYEGLKQVNHNHRPFAKHGKNALPVQPNIPVYNIPAIIGRLFNGTNFAPLAGVKVELRRNGNLVPMKDGNWQNPYQLVVNTEGTFTFWPESVPAEEPGSRKIFEFFLKIEDPEFEPFTHFFQIPVISEIQTASSFSMDRTFKLSDLYMFPPDGEYEELQYNP